jgi:hypothetical protein
MSETHKGLPVHGYTAQSDQAVAQVNENKLTEERILQMVDGLKLLGACDPRWLAIARTHFEQGFMALNRAIFKPERVKLPEGS